VMSLQAKPQAAAYKMRKLQELRLYIEDEAYQYLERV